MLVGFNDPPATSFLYIFCYSLSVSFISFSLLLLVILLMPEFEGHLSFSLNFWELQKVPWRSLLDMYVFIVCMYKVLPGCFLILYKAPKNFTKLHLWVLPAKFLLGVLSKNWGSLHHFWVL